MVNQYTIIISEGSSELIKRVEEAMEQGWMPQGGLCISEGIAGTVFMQAMLKE